MLTLTTTTPTLQIPLPPQGFEAPPLHSSHFFPYVPLLQHTVVKSSSMYIGTVISLVQDLL